jgi:hypothetical protein
VPSTPPKPGEPLWVTATLYNNTDSPIQTIKPDCFNTFFSVIDQSTGIPLDPACRMRAAYGIPDDVITIAAHAEFTVTCDLSEMYSPSVLNKGSYTVAAVYSNYIQDPLGRFNLFQGAIESSQSTVTIAPGNAIAKKTAQIIFAPDVWAVEWAWTSGPAISAQISNIQDHSSITDPNDFNLSTIRLNGTVPIISGSASVQNNILTVQFDGSLAVQSLGTGVPASTAYPTIEGSFAGSDVFYGRGLVYLPLRTTASPVGGAYNSTQSITLECNKPATIYYTTDGTDPNENSSQYSGPIPISVTATLKFFAKDIAGNKENIRTEVYTIDVNVSETLDVPATPVRPGESFWVTATFINNTNADIQTIKPDCFNTFFSVTDPVTGEPLNPTCRIRAAYGIAPEGDPGSDVITIGAGASFSVLCDLSEMYSPDVLNAGANVSKTFNVEAVYFNYIQDPLFGMNLFKGAINSTETKTITIVGQSSYIITPSVGPNGSISPFTPQVVTSGGSASFTITPSTGYHIASVTGCGGSLSGNTYTTGSITADCTVTASFAINTYTLTYTAGPNGTISGTSPQTVNYGSSGSTVTAVPNTGYHFVQWSDGVTTASRTDTNVKADISVTASFAINTYTVTPSAGPDGSISPSTPQTVNYNGTASFTISPNTGYHIASVTGCGGSLSGNTYTTGPITTDCTVTAIFASNLYSFTGFFSPVDNPPTVNTATGGQTIPVKWRITDSNSVPISDPNSFVSLTSYQIDCTTGSSESPIPAEAPGASGLQYLGDGNWQYNWKTSKDYKGKCRIMTLTLKDGTQHEADFKFK